MGERVIFHIDVNSAFLSWEAAYRQHHLGEETDLRRIPSAVCGDVAKRRGIILAKSIPAGKFGIHTGETVPEAKHKCPGLILVPPDYGLYEKCSRALMEILGEYSGKVEQYSIDEAFADMTGMDRLTGRPVQAAAALKDRIHRELGFTVNVGVGGSKLLAKMAGEMGKPDQVHTLFREEIERKMWPLRVDSLFFAGPAAVRKLYQLGIRTIGELAGADVEILKAHLKKHGEILWNFANGNEFSPVEPEPPAPKGYGNSTTVPFDVCDGRTAELVLLSLAETLGRRLRRDGAAVRVVGVNIRYIDLSGCSHQAVMEQPTDITAELHGTAVRLFGELWDGTPVRGLGIHTGGVVFGGGPRQISLFDTTDFAKLEKLDRAVDDIRRRFGADAVMRAAFTPRRGEDGRPLWGAGLDHMAGGISREKRTNAERSSGTPGYRQRPAACRWRE